MTGQSGRAVLRIGARDPVKKCRKIPLRGVLFPRPFRYAVDGVRAKIYQNDVDSKVALLAKVGVIWSL